MFVIRFLMFLFAIMALSFTLLMTGKSFEERDSWMNQGSREKRVMVSFLAICWVVSIAAIVLCYQIA